MKRLLIYLSLAMFLTFNFTGCSLFGSSDDKADSAEVAEDGAEEGGDDLAEEDSESATSDGDEFSDEGGDSSAGSEEGGDELVEESLQDDDEFPDDALDSGGDGQIAEVSDDDFADTEDSGAVAGGGDEDDSLFVDEGQSGDQELPAEPMSSNEEQDLFAAGEGGEESGGGFYEPPAATGGFSDGGGASLVPVKKMKPAAYRRGGSNVNRLYVARAGDTMSTVSQKIYGTDRSADLLAINSHFKGRKLKVGDKIYYSSPNSPNDPEMKTYYEDNGIAPQYYTSQKGENIRGISKKLLGHERSWMEIYATNGNVNSKWDIPAGTQMRYWPEGAASMAAAPVPAPEPAVEEVSEEPMPVEEVAEAAPEEIPPADPTEVQEVAQIDEPAATDIDEISEEEEFAPPPAAGTVAPPPPPAPKNVAPPPPPPAPLAKTNKPFKKPTATGTGAGDDSMIMGALGGLLILAAIILLIFIRRSRAKRVNFSQTQV